MTPTDYLTLDPVLQDAMVGTTVTTFEYSNGDIRISFENGAMVVGAVNSPGFYLVPPMPTREPSVHA